MTHWFGRMSLAAAAIVATGCLANCSNWGTQTTELVIWQTETDPKAKKVLEDLAVAFEKSHPGVDVQIESVPWGSLSEKLSTALRNDDPPDIAHLEPFMAYGLVERGLLSPIDDLITDLEKANGPILPAVRDLQRFDGKHYGIAYAVGVTGWTFDTRKAGGAPLPYPVDTKGTITQDAFFKYLAQVKAANPGAKVLLPGGTPFFMDQLFGELVANNGGRLFEPSTRTFQFTSEPVRRALEFFVRLQKTGMLSNEWQGQQYVEQFKRLAQPGSIFLTPVTYARASVAIDKELTEEKKSGEANAGTFRFTSPPTGRPGTHPVATIDAEPFVIFERTASETAPGGGTKRQLAVEFLKAFYERGSYLRFVSTVPIHLTPIFSELAVDAAYTNAIAPGWKDWHEHTLAFLKDSNLTRPILVPGPDASRLEEDLRNPYLLQLEAQGIISKAISAALQPDADINKILNDAQQAATRLVDHPIEPAKSK
jgi:ABC-type glycerol-3-phosphate transport system substrate-binding protein